MSLGESEYIYSWRKLKMHWVHRRKGPELEVLEIPHIVDCKVRSMDDGVTAYVRSTKDWDINTQTTPV